MVNRSIKPEGYIGLGKAAKILDITVHRLEYLCKTGRVKFETAESGRKVLREDSLAILPKPGKGYQVIRTSPVESYFTIGFTLVSV